MGIGSWLKRWRKREDDAATRKAQNEFFDTPEEQRMESGDIESMQADYQAGLILRDSDMYEEKGGSADPEERLAEEEER